MYVDIARGTLSPVASLTSIVALFPIVLPFWLIDAKRITDEPVAWLISDMLRPCIRLAILGRRLQVARTV